MNKNGHPFSLLLILLLLYNCTSINDASQNDPDPNSEQVYPFILNDLSDKAFRKIAGITSITHFIDKESFSIHLPKNPDMDFVLVLNDRKRPIMATRLFGGDKIIANHKHTALTITSLFVTPFTDESLENVLLSIEHHPKFEDLTSRIATITEANVSFLDDIPTQNLVRKILDSLYDQQNVTSTETHPNLAYSIKTDVNKNAHVFNNSKFPLYAEATHIVEPEADHQSLIPGFPLNSDLLDTSPATSTRFSIKNGAYDIRIHTNEQTNVIKIQKLTRDMIFKLHNVFGISSEFNKRGLETLIANLTISSGLGDVMSKKEAIAFVQGRIYKNRTAINKYMESTIQDEELHRRYLPLFTDLLLSVLKNQGSQAPVFSDDTFYTEWDAFQAYNESDTFCAENGKEVDCSLRLSPIQHSVEPTGCLPNEQEITFGSNVYAPFGLDTTSKIRINWEFLPQGSAGFWIVNIPNGKLKVNSRIESTGCFDFGNQEEVVISQYVIDHDRRRSNSVAIHIPRPKSKLGQQSGTSKARIIKN